MQKPRKEMEVRKEKRWDTEALEPSLPTYQSLSLPAPHLPDSQAASYQWVGLDAVSSRPGVLRGPQEHTLRSQVFSVSSISILFWLKAFIPLNCDVTTWPPFPCPPPQ